MVRFLILSALLSAPAAAAITGVTPLWRGPLDNRGQVRLLHVEGGTAWLLYEHNGVGGELVEVDLERGTSLATQVDLAGARRAIASRADATDADRAVLATLLRHGWAQEYVAARVGVAAVPGGFITTGGAPSGTLGDWLWRYDTGGAPIARFTEADAGYRPMLSPDGEWLPPTRSRWWRTSIPRGASASRA